MRLEKLLRRLWAHFRRNHAEQVILHPDYVHGRKRAVFHYDFQSSGKFLSLLALPVEPLAYGDPVQLKGRLRKEGGRSLLLEEKFVVEGSVIVYFALAECGHSRASPVRVHSEFYPVSRHNAHADMRLDPCQAADYSLLIFCRQGDFT